MTNSVLRSYIGIGERPKVSEILLRKGDNVQREMESFLRQAIFESGIKDNHNETLYKVITGFENILHKEVGLPFHFGGNNVWRNYFTKSSDVNEALTRKGGVMTKDHNVQEKAMQFFLNGKQKIQSRFALNKTTTKEFNQLQSIEQIRDMLDSRLGAKDSLSEMIVGDRDGVKA